MWMSPWGQPALGTSSQRREALPGSLQLERTPGPPTEVALPAPPFHLAPAGGGGEGRAECVAALLQTNRGGAGRTVTKGHREAVGEKGKSAGKAPAVPPEPPTPGADAAPDLRALRMRPAPGLLPPRGPPSPRGRRQVPGPRPEPHSSVPGRASHQLGP